MIFLWPWMLISILLVPVLAASYIRLTRKTEQTKADNDPMKWLQTSAGKIPGTRRHLPGILFLLGLTVLLVGMARPEMEVDLPRIEGTVILAFDVSNSMSAKDIEPSRMEAAKSAAKIFVENQPSTIQLGVVAFSNGGFVLQPPTNDQSAVLAAIDRLTPQGATSLGQGIFSSLNAITGEAISINPDEISGETPQIDIGQFPSAVVLMLTDGENTSSPDPLEIAQLAADAGVRIYPVGIGSPEGTVLEIDGYNVITQLNEIQLQQIASLTNGSYYYAEDQESLQEIYDSVDLQLTIRGDKIEVTALFAGLSLLILLIGSGLSLLWFGRMPI
jgi:Ca-activated chloride channel family protein